MANPNRKIVETFAEFSHKKSSWNQLKLITKIAVLDVHFSVEKYRMEKGQAANGLWMGKENFKLHSREELLLV